MLLGTDANRFQLIYITNKRHTNVRDILTDVSVIAFYDEDMVNMSQKVTIMKI